LEAAEGNEVAVGLENVSVCELVGGDEKGDLGCRKGRTNNLLRKSPTSSVVEGPPMFINTIAVGPLEEVDD